MTRLHQSKKAAKGDAEDGAEEVKVDKVEVNYGPKGLKSGENVFGIVHIYASFNDTFVVRGVCKCVMCLVCDCDVAERVPPCLAVTLLVWACFRCPMPSLSHQCVWG